MSFVSFHMFVTLRLGFFFVHRRIGFAVLLCDICELGKYFRISFERYFRIDNNLRNDATVYVRICMERIRFRNVKKLKKEKCAAAGLSVTQQCINMRKILADHSVNGLNGVRNRNGKKFRCRLGTSAT